MIPKLHFRRFEFKYLLRPDQERAIKRALSRYMIRDPIAAATKNGWYEVLSLYFDSPRYYYYHEKIDGVKRRKKLRFRTYRVDGDPSDRVFFEIKRKDDAIIMKDRFFAPRDQFVQFNSDIDGYGQFIEIYGRGTSVAEEYAHEVRFRSVAPRLLVAYEREPFFGKFNQNVRITFDRKIRARETDRLWYQGDEYIDISRGATVMELKFSGVLPVYIHDLIREFDLSRIAYSKYCRGIEGCGSLSYQYHPYQHLFAKHTKNNESSWNLF